MASAKEKYKQEKGQVQPARAEDVRRYTDNDLDQLASATAVALAALADIIEDTVTPESVDTRVKFLRQLSQEVSRLGIPF